MCNDDADDDKADLDTITSILVIPLMVTLTPIIASKPPHNCADYCDREACTRKENHTNLPKIYKMLSYCFVS